MKAHELKCWPTYFEAVRDRVKNFEVRENDRDFRVKDILKLQEYDPDNGYTGRVLNREVTFVLSDPQFVKPGFVVMSIE